MGSDSGSSASSEFELHEHRGSVDIRRDHSSVIVSTNTDQQDNSNDDAVWLAWKNVTVYSQNGKKVLLKDVCGEVRGRFLAIMGPSGSGKTTLMNVLARRIETSKVNIEGEARIDGKAYSNSTLKRLSGYVMQDDLLFPHITVIETLRYAAALRLPQDMPASEREDRVQEVIAQLNLEDCRNTIVGNATIRGISGGERKRVCVAIELLTKPKVLFLDEPTSGLDSVTAYTLCSVLKDLAATRGCTVVCTIHQPQTKIFELFDSILLINRGRILYHGPADKVVDFYAQAGFPCPPRTNPADHILDVITAVKPDQKDLVKENEEKLLAQFGKGEFDFGKSSLEHHHPDQKLLDDEEKEKKRNSTPWIHQFRILFHRAWKEQWRQRRVIGIQLIQNIIIALLVGFVFYQIGDTQYSTVRRQPLLFFTVINQGIFGALMLINAFPSEREIVLRERAAGTYHVSAYFFSKIAVDSLIQIIYPIIFSTIVYWIVGLQADAGKFFLYMFFIILCSYSATSMALMISTICRTTLLAVNVLPMALEVVRLFGGFFLSPANLPDYFVWLDVLSYIKYTYVGISLNELTGLKLRCLDKELKNGVCPITTGEQTIETLGLDKFTIGSCIGALICYIFVCRTIAFIALKYLKK